MDINFEGRVWRKAAQVYGARLQKLVDEGVQSFKRRPGLDDPTRVNATLIRTPAFEALQGVLEAHDMEESAWSSSFMVVRSHLRMHLRSHLQWQLMQTADWSDEIVDSYFAGELGL